MFGEAEPFAWVVCRPAPCGVRELAPAVFGRGLPRPIRGVTKCEEHARASPCGRQRRQAAARPTRCAVATREADSATAPSMFAGPAAAGPYEEKQEVVCSASVPLAFLTFGVRGENRRQDAGATNTLGGCVRDNGESAPSSFAGRPPRRNPTKKKPGAALVRCGVSGCLLGGRRGGGRVCWGGIAGGGRLVRPIGIYRFLPGQAVLLVA